jgi:LCP family protein required for cell wall assembly
MTTAQPPPDSARRTALAGILGLLLPGLGHALLGRRRATLVFLAPVLALIACLAVLYASGGFPAILAFVVTPGVLPILAAVNVAIAVWRVAASVDVARGTPRPTQAFGVLGPAILLLVLVPHLWLGSTIAATSDFLDSMFARGPGATEAPFETPPPGWTFVPEVEETPYPSVSFGPVVSETPWPTRGPIKPMTAGTGGLPPLGAAVPWERPGAVPWGDDGRFDLLLLGSDAGRDRWSRRMDVMLLVEVDVATGKVAMVGLPRNLQNTPLPPGPAHDAVACGCYASLLNGLYVEATVLHPERWPGDGAVAGIGAVRSVVSELTKRPVDAVLVVDLWGMIKVVDALGGIDIRIPAPVYDPRYPDSVYGKIEMSLPAGQQHLDGREALFYARTRHQDSDYGRMGRQQTLLLAVRRQIGPQTVLNAPDLFAAAKAFAWTDLPRDSLPNLANLFGTAQAASVRQLRIVPPTYASWLTTSEITRIRRDIAALLGVPVPPTPSPSIGPSPAPSIDPSPAASPEPTDSPVPTESPPLPSESPPPPTESPGPS